MAGTSFGGSWTLQKLGILRQYLDRYTTALKNKRFTLFYVDAFAGEGSFRLNAEPYDQEYGDFTELYSGSPRIALGIQDKPFDKLVFSEIDPARYEILTQLRQEFFDRDIEISNEDANDMLARFCRGLRTFDRAVVFLDPFATSVSWSTIEVIAETQKIDCWILFPVGTIARLMPKQDQPSEALARRLDRIFGSRESWSDFYRLSQQMLLFEEQQGYEREMGSRQIADRYRKRLEEVFFQVAPTRKVLRNSRNSPMFELYFGASNPAGAGPAIRIADHILNNW